LPQLLKTRGLRQEERRGVPCSIEEARLAEDGSGFGEGPNRQPVPGGDDLVIEAGPDAFGTSREKPTTGRVDHRIGGGRIDVHLGGDLSERACNAKVIAAFEGALFGDSEKSGGKWTELFPHDFGELVCVPDVERAFRALGIRVLRRGERAAGKP